MLTRYGLPLLRWLDEALLPETRLVIEEFAEYVVRWREVLEDEALMADVRERLAS